VPRRDLLALPVVCLLSGAAGLVFEMVWFHRASLVFGSSVWSASVVLSSFMGGLTIGSGLVGRAGHRVTRHLAAYALAEIVVATSGVGLTTALPGLTRAVAEWSNPAGDAAWMTNTVRFVTAFALLLVPSAAMGTTLPLLVAALASRRPGRFGRVLGICYGCNTLGAVAGVLGAEVWAIAALGIAGTAWMAALLCATAALVAWRLDAGAQATRARDGSSPTAPPARHGPTGGAGRREAVVTDRPRAWALLAASFLAGGALLALEVVWFRFLTMFVLSTTLAASTMLAVVLAGIGAGGLMASAWLGRNTRPPGALPLLACVAGATVAATYTALPYVTGGVQIASWPHMLWLAVALTLPTSLCSGAFFTLLGDTLQRALVGETRTAGWLTVANTAGGMCGPIVAAFVMLPALGLERSLFALSAAYAGVGLLTLAGGGDQRATGSPAAAVGGLTLVAALLAFPFGLLERTFLARVTAPYAADGSRIVASREGPSESILLMQQQWMDEPVYTRLVTNGFSMSGTSAPALRYMRYFVYWPMAVHPGPIRRVLVVCYGVGVTAGAALDLPDVEAVHVAEISRDVVAMSPVIHGGDDPLAHPRVRLHVEDGRQYLHTTSERFDLITGEPPPPRTPGTVNIYTREYFQLIHDRLADGGMTTYWLPVGRPDPGTNVTAIIRAFCDVFDDCTLWNATPFDLMLVGARGQARPVPEETFTAAWGHRTLRSRLADVGFEVPQQLGATFLGDADYLRQLTAGAEPLDDDHPQRLRPVAGRPSLSDPGYGVNPEVTRLYQSVLDPARARQAFLSSPFIRRVWPARVIEASVPYFDHQAVLNQVFWEGGAPLRRIEQLHWLLTETPLRTLPQWLLGTDAVKEAIAKRRDDGTGAPLYARGLMALVNRDYAGASALFAEAEGRGLVSGGVRPLRAYAVCLAGRPDAARLLVPPRLPEGGDERHFWDWLAKRCGLDARPTG
jgi:spermidine synthase